MGKRRDQWLIIVCTAVLFLSVSYGAAAEIFGNYEFRDKAGVRQLEVSRWQEPGGVLFKISWQADGRWGGMSGVADLKGETATYADKDCPLTITFHGNKAVVKAPGCRDRYGALPLDGVYRKK